MLALLSNQSLSQTSNKRYTIAVFSPIYIDSVFDGNNYKLGVNNLPKQILPGLEFYNGVMMAIDSLKKENIDLNVMIYDSKGHEPVSSIIQQPEFENVSLIIASFNNRNDIKPLAEFALNKRVPLISATYPNDGGTENNPYLILINSTLRTHCEELYKYMQRNYALNNIIYVRRKGATEDIIQSYFSEMNKSSIPLKLKMIELTDTFNHAQLLPYLDSTKQNIIVSGTLNEAFGFRLVRTIGAAKSYNVTVIGMPTWDGLKALDKEECNGVNIIYTTPYNYNNTLSSATLFKKNYYNLYASRPSDMAFKGFECMYHFSKLLLQYGSDLINNLSSKNDIVFNEFDIKPTRNKNTRSIDFLENHKLYFVRKLNGQIKP
jgi:hypothetical protein